MDAARAKAPFLDALPPPACKHLVTVYELRRFAKGQVVFAEGQPADAIWLVVRGLVYVEKQTPQGLSATIGMITPDEALCGMSALETTTYMASAVAATDTQALRIPVEDFRQLLETYPALANAALVTCVTRIRHMAEALSLLAAPVEQRLAYALLRLRQAVGMTISVTHQELARMAGTRWETSIRTLAAMKRRGWLASSRGRVTILLPQQLRHLLGPLQYDGNHRRSKGHSHDSAPGGSVPPDNSH